MVENTSKTYHGTYNKSMRSQAVAATQMSMVFLWIMMPRRLGGAIIQKTVMNMG